MIDDSAVDAFAQLEGVKGVFPKMKFTFPARAFGGKRLFGRNLWAEIIADGISPALIQSDIAQPANFTDREVLGACSDDLQCGDGRACQNGQCARPVNTQKNTIICLSGRKLLCAGRKQCELPIPFPSATISSSCTTEASQQPLAERDKKIKCRSYQVRFLVSN